MENTADNKINPYQKKIEKWEIEIDEIKAFVSKLPDVSIMSLPKLLNPSIRSLYSEIEDKQEKLEKIKSELDTQQHCRNN